MILVVDNYDSFTFNLVQALGVLGEELIVRRNDRLTMEEVGAMDPAGVVLSPGPGTPADAGCCVELVRSYGHKIPILGVCLGHQAIADAFGGAVVRANEVVHGKTALISHDGEGVFVGLENPFPAARYHSLAVRQDSLPQELVVNAWSGDVVMGMRHRQMPIHGVQFHPESIATSLGPRLLQNFVRIVAANRNSAP